MHAARLHKSERLQRVHDALEEIRPRWLTTREIVEQAHVVAVSSCVAELRQNGARIDCVREGRVWNYRLAP